MRVFGKLSVIALLFAGTVGAQAGLLNYDPNKPAPAPTLDGGWNYDQVTDPTTTMDSDDSPYVFNLASSATFTITDAYFAGDNYSVFDNGILILSATGPAPSLDYQDDPNAAYADPNFAHGSVVLGAGAHDITVESAVETGIAPAGFYDRLDSLGPIVGVPDAGNLAAITGLLWAGLLGRGTLRAKRS